MQPHPWFNPLWRRVLVACVCAVWFAVETALGDGLWQLIAAGFTGYAIWDFFLAGRYPVSSTKRE